MRPYLKQREEGRGRIPFIIIYIHSISLLRTGKSLVEVRSPRLLGKMIYINTRVEIPHSTDRSATHARNPSTQSLQEDCCESEASLDDIASTRPDRNIVSKDTNKTALTRQPTQHTNAQGLAVPSVALGSAEVSSRAEQTCQFPSPRSVINILVSGAHILYFNKLKV